MREIERLQDVAMVLALQCRQAESELARIDRKIELMKADFGATKVRYPTYSQLVLQHAQEKWEVWCLQRRAQLNTRLSDLMAQREGASVKMAREKAREEFVAVELRKLKSKNKRLIERRKLDAVALELTLRR